MNSFRWKSTYSDSEIIEGLQAGGASFEKYALILYRTCKRYIHKARNKFPNLNEADLHDAYIDAVDAVIRKVLANQFDEDLAKLSTLLYQIFSNKCIDQLRRISNYKNTWQRTLDSITEDLPVQAQDFLQTIMANEEMTDVTQAMDKLGAPCKDLIMDFDYWGFKPDEVAERRGYKSGKSASQAKYRCLEDLRKLMNKEAVSRKP